MLHAIFLILLLQLAGEAVQKYFELAVPGPVTVSCWSAAAWTMYESSSGAASFPSPVLELGGESFG